jgi:hypothetical protein
VGLTILHKRGDTLIWNARYTNPDGSPVDVTNYGIAMQIRTPTGLLIADVSIGAGITLTTPMDGQYQIRIDPNVTSTWPGETCNFDIQYTLNGVVVSSETGSLKIEKDITHAN